jgi:hypothetical protein
MRTQMHQLKVLAAALTLASLGGGAAFAAATMLDATPHPSIIAFNQKLKGDTVSIRYAFLPQDGTVNIYAVNQAGKIEGSPLGKVSLNAGDHRDVGVTLKSSPKDGMRLRAVVEKSGQPFKYSGNRAERTFEIL